MEWQSPATRDALIESTNTQRSASTPRKIETGIYIAQGAFNMKEGPSRKQFENEAYHMLS